MTAKTVLVKINCMSECVIEYVLQYKNAIIHFSNSIPGAGKSFEISIALCLMKTTNKNLKVFVF